MNENTRLIVNACRQVVQSADDYDNEIMTTHKTVVQAIYELDYLLDNIRAYSDREYLNERKIEQQYFRDWPFYTTCNNP